MFVKSYCKNAVSAICKGFQARCDADDFSVPTLVEQADAQLSMKDRIKTPVQFDVLKSQLMGSAAVNSFDGFRLIVAKQVNLNTVSQHTFMLGSSQTQLQPYYNYNLILPLDDKQEKSLRIRSDMDFNLDGEFSYPLQDSVLVKTSFQCADHGNGLVFNVDMSNDSSTSQIECSFAQQSSILFSFMQALTPSFSLGGSNTYVFGKQIVRSSLGAVFEADGNLLAGLYEVDSGNFQALYKKEVNPNRVNLLADLTYDASAGASKMNFSAQYILKQTKLTMGLDSDLVIRSTMESNIAQGVQFSLSAEIPQFKQDQCRFGYGLLMG